MSLHVTRLVLNPVAACAARCRRMLDALARLGQRRMDALEPRPGVPMSAATAVASVSAITRLARVLSLVALLELRLKALLAFGATAPVPAAAHPQAAAADDERRLDAKDRDRTDAADPVERPERPERLDYERPERFDGLEPLDLDRALAPDNRSLTELAAAICRELGLGPDATRRAQAPFAALQALLAGEPPPPEPSRRPPSVDREPQGSPLLETTPPSRAKNAHLDARGPEKPP